MCTTLLQNVLSLAISDEEELDPEKPAMMNNLCRSNNNCLAEQRSNTPFNDESRQLIYNERITGSEKDDSLKGTAGKFLFQLRGERSVLLEYGNMRLPHIFLDTQLCKYQNV